LTKALDVSFDGAAIFGGDRSKRYALVIEDGKVKEAYVEPDNTGVKGKLNHERVNRVELTPNRVRSRECAEMRTGL
jgi:peroxiredoxin